MSTDAPRRLGIAVVGAGGAVATTAAAGLELLRLGLVGHEGLPLAHRTPNGRFTREGPLELVAYDNIDLAGWDLDRRDLATAAEQHAVLEPAQLAAAAPALSAIVPWPAVGSSDFCRKIDGDHRIVASGHRACVRAIGEDLRGFRESRDAVVMVNLASVERRVDLSHPALTSLDGFEAALDADDPAIGPAMLYAYAALREKVPYVNFTPSVGADVPALVELADLEGVPVAGKDGKTGQTMMKTVIAPAMRARALKVDGWFSTNILGNRDGEALDDPASLESKLDTKGSVLDDILGYRVDDHVVRIEYYRPRGDDKEAWDAIDVVGFLGRKMQIKVNFQCRDSVLAAPLVIELARLAELAHARGERGVQEQFGSFFKAPMTVDGKRPEHALHRQEAALEAWLAAGDRAVARR